jgi:transposase
MVFLNRPALRSPKTGSKSMDKKTISNWIMYHEIQRMLREGLSRTSIATTTGMDRRTVKKYASMTGEQYEQYLEKTECRTKVLSGYETFVKERLVTSPGASAAQVHDWLKEHHPSLAKTSPKTVYNFVMGIRQKYNIPLEKPGRDFFVVDQLPYGLQAQADFGQYYLRSSGQRRKKVYFFVMMLSRSRMKYIGFLDKPFTTRAAIDAHEEAFKYFKGITKEVVYDQDRLFLVDENLGELMLTREFKDYVFEQEFQLHFCRKSDPQSKGKVENVVKFVKNNFLYGRLYHDLETLQSEALAWLIRTGNGMAHATTKKIPLLEWETEKQHLVQWVSVNILPSYIMRYVRKDNTIAYQGSFYSLPQGTHNKSPNVLIRIENGDLIIHDSADRLICKHPIGNTKGKTIINTDHKRDKSAKIGELIAQTAALFDNTLLASEYFELMRKDKGRYIRDHIQAIRDAVSGEDKKHVDRVLQKCMEEKYLSATVFKDLLLIKQKECGAKQSSIDKVTLLDPTNTVKAETKPDKSDLGSYEEIFAEG